jgi:hypothetical protein
MALLLALISVLVTEIQGSAASAAREAFFQPKDLVWLDPCEHSIPLYPIRIDHVHDFRSTRPS